MFISEAHQGYIDGLEGKDPTSESDEYELGWLTGYGDREAGWKVPKYLGPVKELPVSNGSTVTIPEGLVFKYRGSSRQAQKSYKVALKSVDQGIPAYVDYGHYEKPVLVRPTVAKIVWSGTGGYWSECNLSEVCP